MALERANRHPATDTTTLVDSPWNHFKLESFKVGDDFTFTFPSEFDEPDPLFAQSDDNDTFTVADIRKRLSSEKEYDDLDPTAYQYFNVCKMNFSELFIDMLDPTIKNQEHITKLEMMKNHGQYAQRAAVSLPHINFG